MSEKIKIETVNKISQIYSVDVHCNPLTVDVRLAVEKNVAATSEPMRDEESAKANAYAKAKGEFKVDVIVDPSFVIRTTFSNGLFAFIAMITLGLVKSGVRFVVTISGYAGYYSNPRSYYEQQKNELSDLSEALETAFSDSPKITPDERKLIERLRSENFSHDRMSPSEQEVLKKYNKIRNKSGQALVFKSIFYPNIDTQEYDYSKTTQAETSITMSKISAPKFKSGVLLKVIKPLILIGVLFFVLEFAINKVHNLYKNWENNKEMERQALEEYSSAIYKRVISIQYGFSELIRGGVDTIVITSIKWDYKVEDYKDSVEKYDNIRLNFLKKYTSEYMPKIIEIEAAAAKITADSLAAIAKKILEENTNAIGEWNGFFIIDNSQLLINIESINDDGSVTGFYVWKKENSKPLTGFKNGKEFVLKTTGNWVFRFTISNNVATGIVEAVNGDFEITLTKL